MKNSRYLILALLIYMNELSGVTSKNNPVTGAPEAGTFPYCASVEFLSESNVTKQCAQKREDFLCSILQDFSIKWCLQTSVNKKMPEVANPTQFDSYISRFESLDDLKHFCETLKNDANTNPFECSLHCLDPLTENKKPQKLCSALAWLQNTIKSVDEMKPNEKSEIVGEAAVKSIGAQDIQKQNEGEKLEGGNKSIAGGTEVATPAKNLESKSENKQVDTPKTRTKPIAAVDPKKVPESPANPLKISEKQSFSVVNSAKINEQSSKKSDQSIILSEPDDKKESPVQKKNGENISGVETTGNKPEMNELPEASAAKIDKKTEPSIGKTEKMQKLAETKSSTLSDNTNDIIDSTLPREDVDILDNEDDQIGDIGLPNPEPEFVDERRKIPRLPGRETEEESHIFSYFVVLSLMVVCCFIGYHNKKKILAMLLEGRRSRSGRNRRRPSTANYRKLDCNLEEAVTSQCNSNVTHVIY